MLLPFRWRITKYNPAFRNEKGHYLHDDWTFFAQVGRTIDGKLLTLQEYMRAENVYVAAVMRFLTGVGIAELTVTEYVSPVHSLAHVAESKIQDITLRPADLWSGKAIGGRELEEVIRLILREATWCKLEKPSSFYLHFGWDYYMYVGSAFRPEQALKDIQGLGLFVEECTSPYLEDDVIGAITKGGIVKDALYDSLYSKIKNRDFLGVENYLDAGGDPSLCNRKGWSLLMAAASKGNLEIVTLLLDRDADINALTKHSSESALTMAASSGRTKSVRLLLERGASVSVQPLGRNLAKYMETASSPSEDVLRLLRDAGMT